MLWLCARRTAPSKATFEPQRAQLTYGYELDHRSLFAANELDEAGYEVGIYHSHPRSAARPSQTDINLAHPHWTRSRLARRRRAGGAGLADRRRPCGRGGDRPRWLTRPRLPRHRIAEHQQHERFCSRCGMPLVRPGTQPLDEPLSEAHARARKSIPSTRRGRWSAWPGGGIQAEAELIQGLLLEEGVPSMLQRTPGFDVPDFLAAGPRDVLVPRTGAEAARELLLQAELGPAPERAAAKPNHLRLVAAIAIGGGAAALLAWLLQGGS